jgi:uncharacterized protein (DUF488 family)
MPPTLYTIGYEKRTQEEFFGILARARIGVLMDVRDVAWSHKPGFAKGALAETAMTAGMEYVHAQFAGNPKRLREKESDTEELLDAYGRHLDRHPEILDEFTTMVRGYEKAKKRVCIMCFERDPGDCHRGVLAARWKRRCRGKVEHLGVVQVG